MGLETVNGSYESAKTNPRLHEQARYGYLVNDEELIFLRRGTGWGHMDIPDWFIRKVGQWQAS